VSIALVFMLSTVSLAGAGTPVDSKVVKERLAAEYRQIEEGFRKNDPTAWIQRLSPEFQLTLFSGQKQNREWVVDYVRNNAKTFRIQKLNMRVKSLEVNENAVTAIEQTSIRTFTDDKGQPHRLEVGALQRETWEQGSDGWRLKAVQEWKLLYLRKH
jgi:hypothetical protein